MSSPPSPNLDRFVRAVHRRWVFVRLLERTGQCSLIGCAAGLVLVPILLWRGQAALSAAVTVVLVGVGAGVVLGLTRRPGLHASAVEADRQLDLADLLATALAARRRVGDDPWAATVLATAEHRCCTLSPDALVLNRLGARAWGGIGLAAALLFTLAMMSARPVDTRAGAVARPRAGLSVEARPTDAAESPAVRPEAATRRPANGPSSDRPFGGGGQESQSRPSSEQTTDPAAADQRDSSQSAPATADGRGAGASRTPDGRPHRTPTDTSRTVPTSDGGAVDPSAESGRGPGRSGQAGAGTENAGQDAVNQDATGGTVPPWTSSSWPADRAAAEESLRRGTTLDAYRDVMWEYFNAP